MTIKATHLSDKDLERYRRELELKRSELVGDIQDLEDEARQAKSGDLSHTPQHLGDEGSDTEQHDSIRGMAETDRQLLDEVNAALERLAEGTYGVCERTGQPIPKTRLDAIPWTRYTIEAEREIEAGG